MNDLTHSGFGSGSPARMTSQEIADLLNVRHDNVRRTVERLVEKGVIASPPSEDVQKTGGNNRTYTTQEYVFSGADGKRDSYVVVAQLSPEFTAKLVDRWQELEKVLAVGFTIPSSFSEALRLAADNADRAEKAEAQIVLDAPKVAFADQVEAAPDAISLSQAAKVFGTGRNRLCSKLRELGWLTRTNEPYQDKINTGYLDVKIGSWDHPEKGLQRSVTALVTGKGMVKLHPIMGGTAH